MLGEVINEPLCGSTGGGFAEAGFAHREPPLEKAGLITDVYLLSFICLVRLPPIALHGVGGFFIWSQWGFDHWLDASLSRPVRLFRRTLFEASRP